MMFYNDMMYYYPYMNPYINYHNYYEYEKEIDAVAYIHGGPLAPHLKGIVYFEKENRGTKVKVKVFGLPKYEPTQNSRLPIGPHGFHIHEHGICEIGDPKDPFKSAGGHWNPDNQPHGSVYSLIVLS